MTFSLTFVVRSYFSYDVFAVYAGNKIESTTSNQTDKT